jgi:hypothetical protein
LQRLQGENERIKQKIARRKCRAKTLQIGNESIGPRLEASNAGGNERGGGKQREGNQQSNSK